MTSLTFHRDMVLIPYSRLFSLGANFPEFHEWAHSSGKFIVGCYKVRMWDAIAEIGMDAIMSRWPINLTLKPWVAKYISLQLQPKLLKWLGACAYTASDKRPVQQKVW